MSKIGKWHESLSQSIFAKTLLGNRYGGLPSPYG